MFAESTVALLLWAVGMLVQDSVSNKTMQIAPGGDRQEKSATAESAYLGALGFLARHKVLGLVALVKDDAAVKGGPPTPFHYLLQPDLAFHVRDQGSVCPAMQHLAGRMLW